MDRIIGTSSHTFADKIKNVVVAYVIMVIWVFSIVAFLQYLIDPTTQFRPQPPLKFTFFMSCIFAPAWEELLFRYVPVKIAKGFDPKFLLPVVILSSAIFGWGHGAGPVSLLIQGVMGFILACVYLKNGSLIYSIILHSAWNISCLFLFPRIS